MLGGASEEILDVYNCDILRIRNQFVEGNISTARARHRFVLTAGQVAFVTYRCRHCVSPPAVSFTQAPIPSRLQRFPSPSSLIRTQ